MDTVGQITFFPWASLYRRRFTQAHLKCCPKPGQETKERFIRSENKNKTKQQHNNNTKVKKIQPNKNKTTKQKQQQQQQQKKNRRICSLAPVITLILTLASPCLFQTQSVEISDPKIQDLCNVVKYTSQRKRWTSNLSGYLLVSWHTYPRNETCHKPLFTALPSPLTATPEDIFPTYMISHFRLM